MLVSVVFLLLVLVGSAPQSSDADTRFSRAYELQKKGALQEAATEYRALLKISPDNARALANLGVVLAQLGEYPEAIASYEKALRLEPQLKPILLNIGIAYFRSRNFFKAAESLEKYLQATPDSLQARQLLGLSLVEIGRDAEAIRYLESSLAAAPNDPSVLYALGLAYLRGRRPELFQIIDRLEKLPTGIPAAHFLRGQFHLMYEDYGKATAEFLEARKLNPDLPRLEYSLGLAHLKNQLYQDAIQCFTNELKRYPEDFSSHFYIAYTQEAAGNIAEAELWLGKAMKFEPDSPAAQALLGRIRMKQGRDQEALSALESSTRRNPQDTETRYVLARLYQKLGRRDEAAKEFAEVQRLKTERLEKTREFLDSQKKQ